MIGMDCMRFGLAVLRLGKGIWKKLQIRRLRTLLRNMWSLSLIPLVWGIYGFFSGEIAQIVWGFALAVLPLGIRPVVTQLAGRYLLERLKTAVIWLPPSGLAAKNCFYKSDALQRENRKL